MSPLDFADRLMAFCFKHKGSVSSWGRSPERNTLVGGHPDSKHQVWLAGDVVYAPNPVPNFTEATKTATQLGIKLVRESDHDHLQV